jgi:EAL domain-containing protein (putative c-di-GMP-specific phosphodiesterase class I)
MIEGLRRALVEDEFELCYQPQIDIETGLLYGMEALIRWRLPNGQLVLPNQFIHLAESSRLIGEIGAWVIRSVCRQIRSWMDRDLPFVRIAVNLSAVQIQSGDLLDLLAVVLPEYGIDGSSLEFEITESMVMADTGKSVRTLTALKELGATIAVDDFGTGYSSLSYLKRLPIDILKVDKSFIDDLETDLDGARIVHTIIDMAHNLELKVVAEGIENQAQLSFLRDHSCDIAQGYLFSKPLKAKEIMEYLRFSTLVLPSGKRNPKEIK